MPRKNVVILDGAASGDKDLPPILSVLSEVLRADGAQVEILPLREAKPAHWLCCFGCWIKTLGMCVEADAGREIARAIIRSEIQPSSDPLLSESTGRSQRTGQIS
jgi:hypothetical protein